jgi:hypothetical protein
MTTLPCLHIKWIEIHLAGVCWRRWRTPVWPLTGESSNGGKQTFTFARTSVNKFEIFFIRPLVAGALVSGTLKTLDYMEKER